MNASGHKSTIDHKKNCSVKIVVLQHICTLNPLHSGCKPSGNLFIHCHLEYFRDINVDNVFPFNVHDYIKVIQTV